MPCTANAHSLDGGVDTRKAGAAAGRAAAATCGAYVRTFVCMCVCCGCHLAGRTYARLHACMCVCCGCHVAGRVRTSQPQRTSHPTPHILHLTSYTVHRTQSTPCNQHSTPCIALGGASKARMKRTIVLACLHACMQVCMSVPDVRGERGEDNARVLASS